MTYTAQLRYITTKQVVFTMECDGASKPVYTFEDSYLDLEDGMLSAMQDRYDVGLYGTGSVGQVRDAVHAMSAVTDLLSNTELVIPSDTKKKIESEIKRDEQALDGGVY